MKSKFVIAASLSALVGLAGPTWASSKSDCAAGAVVGGVLGGLIGNELGHGNDGSTIAGVGLGAILGGSIACDQGHGRNGPPPHDRSPLPINLMDRTLRKSFNYRVGATIERSNDFGDSVRVTTYNESWYRRGTICRDYDMSVRPAYGRSRYFGGTVCQDARGNVYRP